VPIEKNLQIIGFKTSDFTTILLLHPVDKNYPIYPYGRLKKQDNVRVFISFLKIRTMLGK